MSAAVTLDSLTYYLSNQAIASRPTAWTVSLHSAAPGVDGIANELAYSGYARRAVVFDFDDSAPAAPFASNTADLTFPAPGTDQTVTHVVVWGGSVPLVIQALRDPKTLPAGVDAILAAGELIIGGTN
ncbi:phage tail fiber protein [Pseudomonas sp. UBA7530]|uniref:phage tail fiber protein n=1 Tax=Pseudomonas sp. UBA7530 TaxID=1947341 RepID=UPI0025DDBA15|nr:hypothetical protein [Pseudomonas sp. UBA7530]